MNVSVRAVRPVLQISCCLRCDTVSVGTPKNRTDFPTRQRKQTMNTTEHLHKLGQSLWLDTISRELIHSGTLQHYIATYDVTGLTSNPTLYEQAIRADEYYGEVIQSLSTEERSDEDIFFELAIADLTRAAALFAPVHNKTAGIDGWVSLEVSPLLANQATQTIQEAINLHARAGCANLLIKIPGTPAGLLAFEECIFHGVPVNVTLLFSSAHYVKCAHAYMRAIERRIQVGLDPAVTSVASVFISRWDVAVNSKVDAELHNKLGLAVAQLTNRVYQEVLNSKRWKALAEAGARPQRLLWASTGSKDPALSDTFYIQELATPDTINTMPEQTLLAFGDHGLIGHTMSVDGDNAKEMLAAFKSAGIDVNALADQLQSDGTVAFIRSWHALLDMIATKRHANAGAAVAQARSEPHCV